MSPASTISSVSSSIRKQAGRIGATKLAASGGAIVFALTLAVSAGAAPSPFEPFEEVLGLGGEHGTAVSEAVEQAKEDLEEGAQVGPAVSEAACTAAHDRNTLPEGAQNAPGQQDREPKVCVHPSNAVDEDGEGEGVEDGEEVAEVDEDEDAEEMNHGQTVSQAVHDARTAAQEAGEKVGPAVSEAACTAAHDRGTLPEGAQNAPGQQDREPKDCTHPSNAGDEGEGTEADLGEDAEGDSSGNGNGNGHGKENAPGQQKKQSD
jgi:hypothetical protein